jgi:hypothetical protein
MKLHTFRRALVGGLAAILLGGGLPTLLGTAQAAGCLTWTDPTGDMPTSGDSTGTVNDAQMDIVGATLGTVGDKLTASITVVALRTDPTDGNDEFYLEFLVKGHAIRMFADRYIDGSTLAGFRNVDVPEVGATGEGTATWDVKTNTVTIAGTVPELSKAVGEDAANQGLTEIVATTRDTAVGGPGIVYDQAATDQLYTVGVSCDGGPQPSASATGSAPPSANPCVVHPQLAALDPAITTGQRARVRYTGNPGATVRIEGYSRSAGVTPQYAPFQTATVPENGTLEISPTFTTNTRLRASEEACPEPSESVVVQVRLVLSALTAVRNGVRDYTFSGRLTPGRQNQGRGVDLLYRSGGGTVRKAVARISGDRWSARVRFTGNGELTMLARSGNDVVNLGGSSPDRPTRIY